MKGFLAKKKTKDVAEPVPTIASANIPPAQEQTAPAAKRTWRRKKADAEPAKQEFTIELPSADNFRTSLIMPNLSARFSMLKEQNDPLSLLGKASDDSVLDGPRKSASAAYSSLNGGLADIAERPSISDSQRPSVTFARKGSYALGEGYCTDDEQGGSIMSRARPGEGNMLFGGRQKIYRIPIGDHGSVNSLGRSEARGMRGRALYEDDVNMSAFQKLREKEKQLERERQLSAEHDDQQRAQPSPSLYSHSDKRDTTSSINSGPSTASTAPTSVHGAPSPIVPSHGRSTSPGDRGMARSGSRRLYDNVLDQQMQDHQTRLASLRRDGSNHGPQSAGAFWQQANSSPELRSSVDKSSTRPISPFPNVPIDNLTTFQSVRKAPKPGTPPTAATPSNNTFATAKTPFVQALDPSDRNKATATGEFSRPTGFDESQYLQRQISLVQQQKAANQPDELPKEGSPLKKPFARPPPLDSSATNQNSTASKSQGFKDETSIVSRGKAKAMVDRLELSAKRAESSPHLSQRTFLALDDGDDDEVQNESLPTASGAEVPSLETPRESTHAKKELPQITTDSPIGDLRASPTKKEKRRAWSPEALQSAMGSNSPSPATMEPVKLEEQIDEVQTQDVERSELRGMVHQHLRHTSNQSSIYPPKSPAPDATNFEFDYRTPSMYSTMANPWDQDEEQEPVPEIPQTTLDQSRAPTLKELAMREAQDVDGAEWERELRKHHMRDGSSETAHERVAFANELAERQRTIQENLKIRVSNTSRSPSPKPVNANVFENTLKPFGLLRQMTSRETLQQRQEQSGKAMRMLGMSANERPPPIGLERSYSDDPANVKILRHKASSPAPVGRTLHSRMRRQSDEGSTQSREHSRVRQNSVASDHKSKWSRIQESPPESARSSSSRNRSSSATSADGQQGQARQHSVDSEMLKNRSKSGFSLSSNDTLRTSSSSKATRAPLSLETQNIGGTGTNTPTPGSFLDKPRETASPSQLNASMSSADSLSYSTNTTPPVTAITTPNPGPSSPSLPKSSHSMSSDEARGKKEGIFHRTRKPTILKSDISEPTLVTTTSRVDTVTLPAGASLRNGMVDDFDAVLGVNPSAPSSVSSPAIAPVNSKKSGGWFHREKSGTERDESSKFRLRKFSHGDSQKRDDLGSMI